MLSSTPGKTKTSSTANMSIKQVATQSTTVAKKSSPGKNQTVVDENSNLLLWEEFMAKIVCKQYKQALELCDKILELEPNHPLIEDYRKVLTEKLHIDSQEVESDQEFDVEGRLEGQDDDDE